MQNIKLRSLKWKKDKIVTECPLTDKWIKFVWSTAMLLSHNKEWKLAIYVKDASKWNESEKHNNVWSHMWTLKHKTKIRLTHTENKWAVARGDGVGDERNRWMELRGANI